jgi:hypothetical protein
MSCEKIEIVLIKGLCSNAGLFTRPINQWQTLTHRAAPFGWSFGPGLDGRSPGLSREFRKRRNKRLGKEQQAFVLACLRKSPDRHGIGVGADCWMRLAYVPEVISVTQRNDKTLKPSHERVLTLTLPELNCKTLVKLGANPWETLRSLPILSE